MTTARPRIIQSESRRATRAETEAVVRATEPRFYYSDETDLSRFGLPFVEAAARPTPEEDERVVAGPDEEYEPGKWRETWVVEAIPVEEVRAAARAAVTEQRDAHEQGGFAYAGKIIDSDMASCIRIAGAASAAQAALAQQQPFAVDWTCADNSVLALDAVGVVGMLAALAVHSNAVHQHSRTLKAQIEAAATPAEVAAIDVAAGWPDEEA